MTPRIETEALQAPRYLIIKRDLYYRPGSQGYTGIKDHAGRFSLEEVATLFPSLDSENQDGMSFIAEAEAPEFTAACFWDYRLDHVTAQRDAAHLAIAHLGDLVAHYAGQATDWERAALAALAENNRIKAEVARLRLQVEDRVHGC